MCCRATALAMLALAGPARAGPVGWLPPVLGATERMASGRLTGLGLGGLDPVSYLVEGSPRPGLPRYESRQDGVAWRFASAANRAAFERDPGSFLPRLGGHDTVAAASGRVVDADPTVFAIRDGRLYLFRNAEGRRRFREGDGMAQAAEAAWGRLSAGLVGE